MAKKRVILTRQNGIRPYRRVFVIATEGQKTEPQYFRMFNSREATIMIKCLQRDTHSSPQELLKKIKRFIKENGLKKEDEAWIVVDKDNWNPEQLNFLFGWSNEDPRYGLAVSNPMFEYWLVLHFEEGNNIKTKDECLNRLKKYIPDYKKNCLNSYLFYPYVNLAIERAKKRHIDKEKWPKNAGTTVYKIAEKLL